MNNNSNHHKRQELPLHIHQAIALLLGVMRRHKVQYMIRKSGDFRRFQAGMLTWMTSLEQSNF